MPYSTSPQHSRIYRAVDPAPAPEGRKGEAVRRASAGMRRLSTAVLFLLAWCAGAPGGFAQLGFADTLPVQLDRYNLRGLETYHLQAPGPTTELQLVLLPQAEQPLSRAVLAVLVHSLGVQPRDCTATAWQRRLANSQLELSPYHTPDYAGLRLQFPASRLADAWNCLTYSLLKPGLEPDLIRAVRNELVQRLQQSEQRPVQRLLQAARQRRYLSHPLGQTPSQEALQAVTPGQVQAAYRQLMRLPRLRLVLYGPANRVLLDSLAGRELAPTLLKWSQQNPNSQPTDFLPAPRPPELQPVWSLQPDPTPQPGIHLYLGEAPATQPMATWLKARTQLEVTALALQLALQRELCRERALACDFQTLVESHPWGGLHLWVRTDNPQATLRTLRKLLNSWRDQGLPGESVQQAQRQLYWSRLKSLAEANELMNWRLTLALYFSQKSTDTPDLKNWINLALETPPSLAGPRQWMLLGNTAEWEQVLKRLDL